MTSWSGLSSLYQGLIDEQFFPELLMFDWNLINFFKELLVYQQQLTAQDTAFSTFNQLSKGLKELEIYRITGIFKTYHRNRLWKIENFISQKSNCHTIFPRISKSEEYFMKSFKNLLFSHKSLLHDDFDMVNFYSGTCYRDPDKQSAIFFHREHYIFFRLLDKLRSWTKKKNEIKNSINFTCGMNYHSIKYLIYANLLYLV